MHWNLLLRTVHRDRSRKRRVPPSLRPSVRSPMHPPEGGGKPSSPSAQRCGRNHPPAYKRRKGDWKRRVMGVEGSFEEEEEGYRGVPYCLLTSTYVQGRGDYKTENTVEKERETRDRFFWFSALRRCLFLLLFLFPVGSLKQLIPRTS